MEQEGRQQRYGLAPRLHSVSGSNGTNNGALTKSKEKQAHRTARRAVWKGRSRPGICSEEQKCSRQVSHVQCGGSNFYQVEQYSSVWRQSTLAELVERCNKKSAWNRFLWPSK